MLTNFNQIVLSEPIISRYVFEFILPSKLLDQSSFNNSSGRNQIIYDHNYFNFSQNSKPNKSKSILSSSKKSNNQVIINCNNYNLNTTIILNPYLNYEEFYSNYNSYFNPQLVDLKDKYLNNMNASSYLKNNIRLKNKYNMKNSEDSNFQLMRRIKSYCILSKLNEMKTVSEVNTLNSFVNFVSSRFTKVF